MKYVVGLLFDEERTRVALIHKKKGPTAVIGKWNGIGGKVEPGETSEQAMRREAIEESGAEAEWTKFLELSGDGWVVDFLHAFDTNALSAIKSLEEEEVDWFWVDALPSVVPNLRWILPMALGYRDDHVSMYRIQEVA